MSAHESLNGRQFIDHTSLGSVRTPDFGGTVGEPDPVGRMEKWQSMFGGTGEARHYDEGDTPTKRVGALQQHLAQGGEVPPISVTHWHYQDSSHDYQSIMDGHHRAVAAHLAGQGIAAQVKHVNLPY